jgi:hypothetical protein
LFFKRVNKPLNYIVTAIIPMAVSATFVVTNLVKNLVERLRTIEDPVLMGSIQFV